MLRKRPKKLKLTYERADSGNREDIEIYIILYGDKNNRKIFGSISKQRDGQYKIVFDASEKEHVAPSLRRAKLIVRMVIEKALGIS